MNAYFASVEQQVNPSLRNKPVAVTPVICPNGCIISPSYEARAVGVKTGMSLKEAKILCPSIIFRQSNTYHYLKYHQKILKIINNLTPFYQIKSIDELVIKLTPREQNYTSSKLLAEEIKNHIYNSLGIYLKCSIGIGPNEFTAKSAAESKKPDGLTTIRLEELRSFYSKLSLRDLCGINYRMEINLNRLSIFSPLDLFNKDIQELKENFGKAGEYWYLKMNGYDNDVNYVKSLQKSISQSHVLEPRFRNWPCAWSICQKLLYKASEKLRKNNFMCQKIFLFIKFMGSEYFKKMIKIPANSDSFSLTRYLKIIWNQVPKFQNAPLKIAIVLFNFQKCDLFQPNLFECRYKEYKIAKFSDIINDRYGKNTVKPACFLNIKDSAPDRISFGQPNI